MSRRSRLLPTAFLALVVLAIVAGAFGWGVQTVRARWWPYDVLVAVQNRARHAEPEEAGRWRLLDGRRPWLFDDPRAFTQAQLEALGYAEGSLPAPDVSGVVVPARGAWPGLSLVTSGHAPEAVLMDLDGQVVHRWTASHADVFPEQLAQGRTPRPYWRRARLLPDGGLVAMFVDHGLFRLDRDGAVVWRLEGGVHHDVQVVEDTVWVLAREPVRREGHDPHADMLDDQVWVVDLATGAVRRRFSVWDAFEGSPFAARLADVRPRTDHDPMHTNTLQVLDGRFETSNPAFRAGNLLLSLRNTDQVVVIDPVTVQVVWAWQGPWHRQHEPVLVEPGHLLLFDNMGTWPRSRVLEVDPATQAIVRAWDGGDAPLVSETCGTVQRLPNGNTVAVASDTGRVVEVDPQGQVVWSWISPHRSGDEGELIATLFQAERLWGRSLGVFSSQAPPLPEVEGLDTDVR